MRFNRELVEKENLDTKVTEYEVTQEAKDENIKRTIKNPVKVPYIGLDGGEYYDYDTLVEANRIYCETYHQNIEGKLSPTKQDIYDTTERKSR